MNQQTPLIGTAAVSYLQDAMGHPLDVLTSFPKYIFIEPINTCNARCVMCGIDFDSRARAVMSDELIDKIAEELSGYKDHIEKVMLYLDCEPLLDRNLHLKIARLKAAGLKRVNISTNGSILTRRKATEIINAGLDEIYISIDSLDKETFEAIRIRLNFDKVYKNTLEFIKVRNELNPDLVVRIQMISMEENQSEADTYAEHWSHYLGPGDQIAIQKVHNWGHAVDVMKVGDEDTINNIPCLAPWGTFCIHANGDVGLCTIDTTCSILLGNVNEQSIEEIWAGDVLQGIRDAHLTGRRKDISICDGCTLWRESKRDLTRLLGID